MDNRGGHGKVDIEEAYFSKNYRMKKNTTSKWSGIVITFIKKVMQK